MEFMMSKSLGIGAIILGLISAIAGIVLMTVIVPGMKIFPDDVDTTRTFDVAYLTLLDAETLQFLVFEEGGDHDLSINRIVRVEEVDGENTLIFEQQDLMNGDEVLASQVKRYGLDRRTLTPADDIPETWQSAESNWERAGQVIGWPIGVEARDYDGWNEDYREIVDLEFEEEVEHEGIRTYYYTAAYDPLPIVAEHAAVLGLPESLTTIQLAQLANSIEVEGLELELPARLRIIQVLSQALEDVTGQSDAVTLEYYYDYTGEYWVEPTTGVLIDTHKYENRAVTFPQDVRERFQEILEESEQDEEANNYLPPNVLDALLPIQVNTFYYEMTDASIQDAIDDAVPQRDNIQLFGTTIPIGLIILGVVLSGAGGFIYTRKQSE
jgi:hypothetical protein